MAAKQVRAEWYCNAGITLNGNNMELVSKSQADLALQKYEARKAIKRLGQQKTYERGVFERQIKKLNGLTTTEELVMVWKGGITDGKWMSATMLTPLAKSEDLAGKGIV